LCCAAEVRGVLSRSAPQQECCSAGVAGWLAPRPASRRTGRQPGTGPARLPLSVAPDGVSELPTEEARPDEDDPHHCYVNEHGLELQRPSLPQSLSHGRPPRVPTRGCRRTAPVTPSMRSGDFHVDGATGHCFIT